jgi:hypothetical protein
MMKLKISFLGVALVITNNVFAETYYGILNAVTRMGRPSPITFTYNIDLSNKDNITGTLDISGPMTACSGKHEITSGSISNNSITLRTKNLDGPKCGVIRFSGEIEGNKLVGKVPWNGVQTDLELRKQN